MKQALGLVEISGLSTAVVTADTMAKAANIRILEIENTKGLGYMTIKIAGDVGAVNAAVNAGKQIGAANNKLVSWKVIPRPSDYVEQAFCCPDPPVPPSPPMKDGQAGSVKEDTVPEDGAQADAGHLPEPGLLKTADEAATATAGSDPVETETEEPEAEMPEPEEPEAPEPEVSEPAEKPKKSARRASSAKGTGSTRNKNS